MNLKVALAQIKTVTGDLAGNTQRIVDGINRAIASGVDMVVFPETAITHYCCGDLFFHNGFINYQLDFLYKKIIPFTINKNICVVLGFVDKRGNEKDSYPILYNTCAVIQNGNIQTYDKILLARRGQHEDLRYFEPGKEIKVFDLNVGNQIIKWAPVICQDVWDNESPRDVVKECVDKGAKLIIAINQSYFYFNKQNIRKTIVSDHCVNNNIAMVYLNSISVGDITKNIMIYNGGSFCTNANGDIIAQCVQFQEDFQVVDIKLDSPELDNVVEYKKEFYQKYHISKRDKYEEIFNALSFCVKEFFDVCSLKKAMVYLSGGIDSSVVAGIVANAFKNEDIIFVSSPTEDNGEITKNNAQQTADALNIKLHWVSMQKAYNGFINDYKDSFDENPSPLSKAAYQAVGRTAQSIGISHKYGGVGNIGCSNQTENILGFSTFHDVANSSAIGLVNDLTKLELYEMAEYINVRYGKTIINPGLYNGEIKPMAELNDNKGEDPFEYYLYAPICSALIRHRMDVQDIVESYKNKTLNSDEFIIWRNNKSIYENVSLKEFETAVWKCFDLSKRSVFKSAQAGPTPLISEISRGFSSRETLINKYKSYYDLTIDNSINKLCNVV